MAKDIELKLPLPGEIWHFSNPAGAINYLAFVITQCRKDAYIEGYSYTFDGINGGGMCEFVIGSFNEKNWHRIA